MAHNDKKAGNCTDSIKQKMLAICTDYKVYWLWFKYCPQLLPRPFKNFDEMKNYYNKFPNITEQEAELWLYEKPTQNALKELMKTLHNQKMIELYNIYYEKAKNDVQSFKAFIEFSNTFFVDKQENELAMLLKGVKLDGDDNE